MGVENVRRYIFCIFWLSLTQITYAEKIDLNSKVDLFDVGLAKINKDDFYDVFTVNHNFSETFLINNKGKFESTDRQYNQLMTSGFPSLESTGTSPDMNKGFYVFSPKRKHIILTCKGCSKKVAGSLRIPIPVFVPNGIKILYKENATTSIVSKGSNDQSEYVTFEIDQDGVIVLESIYFSLKLNLEVDYKPEEIYVGPLAEQPKSNHFIYQHHDNHGFSWARVGSDDLSDVFATVGGLRANIKHFDSNDISKDLVTTHKNGELFDIYSQAGFRKKDCRSYKAEWIDVDSDGDLDIYVGCKNGENQLYLQKKLGSGQFEEVAKSKGLNIFHGDEFKWQDWNHDGYPDLLVIQKNKLNLYTNNAFKSFSLLKKSKKLGEKLDSVNTSVKVVDYDSDGFLEVFVSTLSQWHVFKQNKKGGFNAVNKEKLGLPTDYKGHLNFVDVNLDGRLDLCLFELGIFTQKKNGTFKKTNKLKSRFNEPVFNKKFKTFLWFDADNNGQWDVIEASSNIKASEKKKHYDKNVYGYKYRDMKQWDSLYIHRNLESKNNWLQIDLEGAPYNKDAIGAKIIVESGGQKQIRYNHGTGDSLHSQGHYRQYFGLGKNKEAKVTVKWPNGATKVFESVKANQLFLAELTSNEPLKLK